MYQRRNSRQDEGNQQEGILDALTIVWNWTKKAGGFLIDLQMTCIARKPAIDMLLRHPFENQANATVFFSDRVLLLNIGSEAQIGGNGVAN